MRFSKSPPTLFSLLSIVLSSTHTTNAKPYPRDELVLEADNSTLERRACANPCGWSGQLCCGSGQSCFTDSAGQAQCGTSGGGTNQQNNNGQWQLYTTTYVETDLVTRTSTYSSFLGASPSVVAPTLNQAPAVTSAAGCSAQLNEIPCGGICCAPGQYCAWQNQCAAVGGGNGDFSSAYLSSVMNTGSAFIRPTSNVVQTVTSTGSATTTVPFSRPTTTSGGSTAGMQTTSNNGLSGGAIAGIVIGVILGIALLLLLCACFCFKGLADGLLGLLGLGPRRRKTETTYIEERHSTHGGGGRSWWRTGPSRVDRPPKRSSGGLGGFAAVAAGLTGLAIALGLKRRIDRRDKSSYGSGSSYSYSDYTSASKYRSFDILRSAF